MIGRAGTGVDNVDMEAATKRGIIVANAPESNSIAAAEHTLALALALCRNVPQAHGSLVAGEWARSRYGGNELYGKTLGVIGFGRIGQLVAKRAQAFDMDVVAFDKFVTPERFRELGVEGVETTRRALRARRPDHDPPAEDARDRRLDRRRGDRADARGRADRQLRPRRAGRPRRAPARRSSRAGRRRRARRLPGGAVHRATRCSSATTSSSRRTSAPRPPRRRTAPASITAEQVRAALTGGVVTNAVNIAAVRPEAMEALAPFVPLCEKLGRLAQGLGDGPLDRVEVAFRGRIAEHDTRLLGIAVLVGILSGHTEEPVNLVNAPAMAEERGIELVERQGRRPPRTSPSWSRCGSATARRSRSPAPGSGRATSPTSSRVWGQSFYMPFADHLAIFRYADQPGMIGRVGNAFGEHGVNIVSAAVGAEAAATARR